MNIKILFSICFVSFINSVAFSQKDKLWYLNLRSSLDVKIGNVNSKLKLTIHNTKLHRITYDGKVYACKIKIQNDSTSIKDVYVVRVDTHHGKGMQQSSLRGFLCHSC
jgi:hypothetical protein